jgi:hypothetical protein
MALSPGARLGVYEIVTAIGAGGMGEVYRAHDTRLRRDVAIKIMAPRDGSAGLQTLLTLTQRPVVLDVGHDGSLYADQLDQPSEIMRYVPSSRAIERIPLPATHEEGPVLPLGDGRLLLAMRTGGRDRIMVLAPGKEPVPFIETQDETSSPMAMLGDDRVVFLAGTPPNRKVAVASISDGRIVRRLARVDGNQLISGLAGSPDGAVIFLVAGGTLWRVPSDDGDPQNLRGADSVAVSRDGRELIILLNEASGIRLVRRTLAGGAEQEVPVRGGVRLTPWPIAPNAVARDGRIVVRVTTKDTWYWPAAILEPRTGSVEFLPGHTTADMLTPGWDDLDRVVTIAKATRGTLWKFRPVPAR